MCHVLHVTSNLSLMPTATATDKPPANSPILLSRLVCKDPKTEENFKTKKIIEKKMSRGMPVLAIRSLTRSLQSTGSGFFTMAQTPHGHCDLETESAQWADLV